MRAGKRGTPGGLGGGGLGAGEGRGGRREVRCLVPLVACLVRTGTGGVVMSTRLVAALPLVPALTCAGTSGASGVGSGCGVGQRLIRRPGGLGHSPGLGAVAGPGVEELVPREALGLGAVGEAAVG